MQSAALNQILERDRNPKRGTCGTITFLGIRIGYVPKHASGARIQTKQVGIVGLHINAIPRDSHARDSCVPPRHQSAHTTWRTHVLP